MVFFQAPQRIRKIRHRFNGQLGHAVRLGIPLGGLLGLLGCVSLQSSDETIQWDPRRIADAGLPNPEFQVYWEQRDSIGIEVVLSVKPSSLVFLKAEGGFMATLDIECRVKRSDRVVRDREWIIPVETSTYEESRSEEPRFSSVFLPVPPGHFVVELVVTDKNSGKPSVLTRSITVPDVSDGKPAGNAMRIALGARSASARPILVPYIALSPESLFCSFQLVNAGESSGTTSTITVIGYGRDTTVANLPYAYNPIGGSLASSGLDQAVPETLCVMTVRSEEHSVRWTLPSESEGLYLIRTETAVRGPGGEEVIVHVERPFVIMPPGYPRPETISELIGSVMYLLPDGQSDSLSASPGTETRRQWLERFWTERAGGKEAASNLLERYYARVEEANLYFASHKPGWQTDRGMVYIVLGPPLEIHNQVNVEIWNYSTIDGDALRTYHFRKKELPGPFSAFAQYVLERQGYYDIPWLNAVDTWRSGGGF